jgi:arylsulfatase A-like enzyme
MTVADSEARLPPVPRPAPGSPNVVVIVLDDTGFAQLGCFGSDIATPNIDGLAAGGLRYNRFHVTSLCSPTRACLLTGRNHHAVGMGFLADLPLAFPGYNGRLPRSAAPLPRLLRDAGYSTRAVGKWHLVPRGERSAAGPFDRWPLGYGFERYYGFLQGDTNHWTPNLVSDNHYVDPPARPEDGYHLSEDLASEAIRQLLDQQHAAPGKPFFLYFALGAMHAPHHVAPSWVAPYRGQFDDGWERWRERAFERQVAAGIVPEGTTLTPRPDWVQSWDQLPATEQRMHARMQEVFAGFLTHTDAQIGRLLEFLRTGGLLDNTLILLFSDNGASAEGGQLGSANEHRFTAHLAESVDRNLAALDDWGGFRTYNHYSWGWAWAGNTPMRLWKRYAWLGGTRTPLIVHWPEGFAARGEVRTTFCHAIDLMPTIFDACGLDAPDVVDGEVQQPIDGTTIRPSFEDASATARPTQYFEMLGSRSIVHNGWKATTDHVSQGVSDEERLVAGSRDFGTDHWALFDFERDFSEAHDVAGENPDVVVRLEQQWLLEAGRNQVMPMDDGLIRRVSAIIPPAYPPQARNVFRPGGGPVGDECIPLLFGGFRMTVTAEVTSHAAEGVLFALGDWNGGFAMFVQGNRLTFAFSNAGELVETTATVELRPGPVEFEASFVPDGGRGGTFHLCCDGNELARSTIAEHLVVALQHGGAGLRIGHDSGFPVSDAYRPPFPWTGTIGEVVVETPGLVRADPETEVRRALHQE